MRGEAARKASNVISSTKASVKASAQKAGEATKAQAGGECSGQKGPGRHPPEDKIVRKTNQGLFA